MIVVLQVLIPILLHFINRLVELHPTLGSEVLIEDRTVESFDKAVALGAPDRCRPMLNILQLKEELEGMLIGSAAVPPSVVGKLNLLLPIMLLQSQKSLVSIEQLMTLPDAPDSARTYMDAP